MRASLLVLALGITAWVDPPPPTPAPVAPMPVSSNGSSLAELPRLTAGSRPAAREAAGSPHVMPAEYAVDLPAHSRAVYLLPPGPKMVREIAIRPAEGQAERWRVARLKLAWETDDPSRASVDLPLGLLFGRFAPGGVLGASSVTSATTELWSCRFPMPYRGDAVLEIRTDVPLNGRLKVMTTTGLPEDSGRFWAAELGDGEPPRSARPVRGRLVGCMLLGDPGEEGVIAQADRAWHLRIDDQAPRPLASAVGLGDDRQAEGDERGSATVSAGPGRIAASFCWRIAHPLPYDRAIAVERRSHRGAGAAPGAVPNAGGSERSSRLIPRVLLFGYEAPAVSRSRP
ncbi:MAG: hypothetical protein U0794_09375 [Isosphaeraceae bacterium]